MRGLSPADIFELPLELKIQRRTHFELNQTIQFLLSKQPGKRPNASHLNILLRYKECADRRYIQEALFWKHQFEIRQRTPGNISSLFSYKTEAEKIAIACEEFGSKLVLLWNERSYLGQNVSTDRFEVTKRLDLRIKRTTERLVQELWKYRSICNKWHQQEIEFWEEQLVGRPIGTSVDEFHLVKPVKSARRKSKIISFLGIGKEYDTFKELPPSEVTIAERRSSLTPNSSPILSRKSSGDSTMTTRSYNEFSSSNRILDIGLYLEPGFNAQSSDMQDKRTAWINNFGSYRAMLEDSLLNMPRDAAQYAHIQTEISHVTSLLSCLQTPAVHVVRVERKVSTANAAVNTTEVVAPATEPAPRKAAVETNALTKTLQSQLAKLEQENEALTSQLQDKETIIKQLSKPKELEPTPPPPLPEFIIKQRLILDLHTCVKEYTPTNPKEIYLNLKDSVKVKMMFIDGSALGHNLNTGQEGFFPLECVEQLKVEEPQESPSSPTMDTLQAQYLQSVLVTRTKAKEAGYWNMLRRRYLEAVREELKDGFAEWSRKLRLKTFWRMIATSYSID